MGERTIRDLLMILRLHIDKLGKNSGLCTLCHSLLGLEIIDYRERDMLLKYIAEHRPKSNWLFKYTDSYRAGFYFTPGKKRVRKKYLEKLIKEERLKEERQIDYDAIFGVDNENNNM